MHMHANKSQHIEKTVFSPGPASGFSLRTGGIWYTLSALISVDEIDVKDLFNLQSSRRLRLNS